MNKYKVKAGRHHEGGRTFEQGQVVESPHDLNALFPNKFRVIKGPSSQSEPEAERRPLAATTGTKIGQKHAKDEGDDSDERAPVQGEDSDISDSVVDDDELPAKKSKFKKRH